MVKPINTRKNKIRFLRLLTVVCAMFFSLSGCRQDYSLAPPANSEKITVTVKLPKERPKSTAPAASALNGMVITRFTRNWSARGRVISTK